MASTTRVILRTERDVFITLANCAQITAALDTLHTQLSAHYRTMATMMRKVLEMRAKYQHVRANPVCSRCARHVSSEGIYLPMRAMCRLYQLTEEQTEFTQKYRVILSSSICICRLQRVLAYMIAHNLVALT